MSAPTADVARPVRVGLRQAAAALRHRNFALFWWSALVSNTGSWVQNVTVPFVLFELTGSAAWVGFASFAQFVPFVVVGPLAGSLADRVPRRRLLLITQSLMALGATGLWAVWAAGVRSPGVLVGVVAIVGIVAGLTIPSWQAFVSELVPRSTLLNAVTLNSAQFNASRALGPALGGVILATLGPSWAFALNALSFGAVIIGLSLIRVPLLVPSGGAARPRVLREFAGTIRYTRARPGIWTCVVVVSAIGLLGSPVFSLVVVFAEEVFDVGRGLYGLLGACLGIGSVIGAPLVAGWGGGISRGRLAAMALVAYGIAVAGFGLAPGYWLGAAALLAAGAMYLALSSALNTTVQLQVDESMRGKVIGLYLMGLTAAVPVGSLVQGWLADVVGPRPTVAVSGALLVAVAVLFRHQDRFTSMDECGSPSGSEAGGDDGASGVIGGADVLAPGVAPVE